jgi:hypothetical protein
MLMVVFTGKSQLMLQKPESVYELVNQKCKIKTAKK